MVKEVDVAACGQGVGQGHLAVPHSVPLIDGAPQPVGRPQVAPAVKWLAGMDRPAIQQRRRGDDLENRAGRNGHPNRAVEKRIVLRPQQTLDRGRVAGDKQVGIETGRRRRDQHRSGLHVHDESRPAGRVRCRQPRPPPGERLLEQRFRRLLQVGVEGQQQIAAHGRLAPAVGGKHPPAAIRQFDGNAGARAERRLPGLLQPHPPDPALRIAPAGELPRFNPAEMTKHVRGQRPAWIAALPPGDQLDGGVGRRVALDLGHHLDRNVADHHVVLVFLGHLDRLESTRLRRRLNHRQQPAFRPGEKRARLAPRGLRRIKGFAPAAIDGVANVFHPGGDFAGVRTPLGGGDSGQANDPLGHRPPLGQNLGFRRRQPLRIPPRGPIEPLPRHPAKPSGVGRLFDPAIVNGQGARLLVNGQHGPVGRENPAADARHELFTHQRRRRLLAKRCPLADLQLDNPAKDDQKQREECGESQPHAAPRIGPRPIPHLVKNRMPVEIAVGMHPENVTCKL